MISNPPNQTIYLWWVEEISNPPNQTIYLWWVDKFSSLAKPNHAVQDFLDLVKNQFGAEAQATLEQFMKSGMTMQVNY